MNGFSAMMKLGTFAKRNQSECKSTRTRTEDGSENIQSKTSVWTIKMNWIYLIDQLIYSYNIDMIYA